MSKLYCVECPFPGDGNSLDARDRRVASDDARHGRQLGPVKRPPPRGPLCRFGAVSALFMADPRRLADLLCVYRATPREIIKLSERDCLAVTPITD